MTWTWVPADSGFSYDFQAASTPEQQQSGTGEYNFHPRDMRPSLEAGREGPLAEWAANCGTDWPTYARERPSPPGVPVLAGRATFQAELDALSLREKAHPRKGCDRGGPPALPMAEVDPPGRPVSGPAGVYLQ